MKKELLKNISRDLNIPEEKILEESIASFLDRELRQAHAEIQKLKTEYQVETPEELEEKIKKGEIKAHPAWEKTIEWERTQTRIEEIQKWRKKISIPS